MKEIKLKFTVRCMTVSWLGRFGTTILQQPEKKYSCLISSMEIKRNIPTKLQLHWGKKWTLYCTPSGKHSITSPVYVSSSNKANPSTIWSILLLLCWPLSTGIIHHLPWWWESRRKDLKVSVLPGLSALCRISGPEKY